MSNIKNIFLAIFISAWFNSVGQQNKPAGLLCELLTHPELSAITSHSPEFGWIVNAGLPGDYQTAYQIFVAPSPFLLSSASPELWDSGKVLSTQNKYRFSPMS